MRWFGVNILRQSFASDFFVWLYFCQLTLRVVDMCSVLLTYDNRIVDIILLQLMVADV